MKFIPEIHHRRSTRLKGYDYSKSGAYFITICTQHRECRFGKIQNDVMILNEAGKMIVNNWLDIPDYFPNIELDEFIVMPNHFHGILFISETAEATFMVAPAVANFHNNKNEAIITTAKTIGDIIGAFKSMTTNDYIEGVKKNIYPVFDRHLWQRNFHDHIIRNEKSLNNIRQYIINNPKNLKGDKFNK